MMKSIFHFALLCFIIFLASCQSKEQTASTSETQATQLTSDVFTPVEQIDPNIYFPTDENIANDPSNSLMAMFREKKAADMANPDKPRPMAPEDIIQIENISHQQPWTPIDQVFDFEWDKIDETWRSSLNKSIKTRIVFRNPDLRVVELAIASGATLPLHAQATPSVYHVLGGAGEIQTEDSTALVTVGTSVTFDAYDRKRTTATSDVPLKILWFSWAPEGNKSYLESGYYLTGSNLHIQPIQAVIPDDLEFWGEQAASPVLVETKPASSNNSSFLANQISEWQANKEMEFYPNDPAFRSENETEWVDMMNLDPKDFFFANDLLKLGDVVKMLRRLAKIKSVFRVHRPDGGYDLTYSYLAWGPQSKYVTHSHAICEFYYLLDGEVEYIINDVTYDAVPGNFYFHPPYYDHEMRGLKAEVPFLSISGSWIPYGRRELFDRRFLLLEAPTDTDASFPLGFDFHDFNLKETKYGVL